MKRKRSENIEVNRIIEIKQEDTTEDEKQDEEQRKEDSISSIVMTEYGIKLEPSLKLEPDAQMETDVEGIS